MTEGDLQFVQTCLAEGHIRGDVLELGCGYGGETCKKIVEQAGLRWFSTDMDESGSKVDYVANFETGHGVGEILTRSGGFDSLLVLNVLEHVFEPVRILDNAKRLMRPGATLVTVTPCVWPIHNYPIDCARLLPDWYRRYSAQARIELVLDKFEYIGYGSIDKYRTNSTDSFPQDSRMAGLAGLRSRIVHRVFNTAGRGVQSRPHIAIGAVFRALG